MHPNPNAAWYDEGIRWIASIFAGSSFHPVHSRDERRARYLEPEEFLFDVRHRMNNRF